MRNFLITNMYNMYNTGEIMQLEALVRHFPKDKFTIASIYSIISIEECARLKVNYIGNVKPTSTIKLVSKAISLLLQALLTRLGITKPKGIIKAYANSDIIINLGGDILSDNVSPIYTLAHCYSLLLAIILDKDYILCSQSIGKFRTIPTKLLAKFVLNRAKLIITREAETTRYIKEELKIEGALIREAIDIAYLTDKTTKHKIPNSIGILTASLSKRQTGITTKQNIELLTKLAMFYTLAGKGVTLIPHVACPIKGIGATANLDDTSIAHNINKLLNTTKIGTASDASRVSLVIGSRMHGLINALANGIPAVALSYSYKFQTLNGNAKIINIKEAVKDVSIVIKAGNEAIVNNRPNIALEKAKAKYNITLIEDIVKKTEQNLIGNTTNCYFGHSTNPDIRYNGASGGIVKSLLTAGLTTGYFNKALTTNNNGILQVNNLIDELNQGSVYHSYTPAITKEQLSKCSSHIGIVCLPCQIKRFRVLFPGNIIIGLFCSHAIELKGLRFIVDSLSLEGHDIKYRHKHNNNTGLLVDNKVFIPSKEYWSKFFNLFFIPKQCLKCRDQTSEKADISVGDAHGHSEFYKGENAIIARTPVGTRLLQTAVELGLIEAEETNLSSIIKTQESYLRIKKRKLTPKLRVYIELRKIGCFISSHRITRPILHLWLKVAVRKESICQST